MNENFSLLASSEHHRRKHFFTALAKWTSGHMGRPATFAIAMGLIVVWLISGPVFGFSDTWQLIINTSTTIVTFLMVFLIQNTQNRESAAVQLKLDELIRSNRNAHTALLDMEELTEEELLQIKHRYEELAEQAREALRRGECDTGIPEVRT